MVARLNRFGELSPPNPRKEQGDPTGLEASDSGEDAPDCRASALARGDDAKSTAASEEASEALPDLMQPVDLDRETATSRREEPCVLMGGGAGAKEVAMATQVDFDIVGTVINDS